jgi:enoyl-CoA hydratase
MTSAITVDVADHIARVTFTRPPVNATDRAAYREITDVFRTVGEDPGVRVVVFRSGGTHFMAGADMKSRSTQDWVAEDLTTSGASSVTDTGRLVRDALEAVYECPVPVIAAVHGVATGSGFAIASLSDFVVAAADARFGLTEINVGKLGGASHLLRAFGPYVARRMFLTGELVSARELESTGFFYRVVDRAELDAAATELARSLARKSPVALRLAKESLVRVESLPVLEGYRVEQDYTRRLSRFADAEEAVAAFLEKRTPKWEW